MNLNEIVNALSAAGYSAKLSRDGQSVVVGCGDKGYFRVVVEPIGARVLNHSTLGRARAMGAMREIKAALPA